MEYLCTNAYSGKSVREGCWVGGCRDVALGRVLDVRNRDYIELRERAM